MSILSYINHRLMDVFILYACSKFVRNHYFPFVPSIFLFILALLILPIYWIIFLLFYTYYQLVLFYVKKYKYNKITYLHGNDLVVCSMENPKSKNIIHCINYINMKSLSHKEIMQLTKNRVQTILDDETKLTCVLRRCLGITFMVQQKFPIEEYVKEFDVPEDCDLEELLHTFTKITLLPMPGDDQGMFQLYVCKRKLAWKNQCTPVIFRGHHAFADGFGLLNAFARYCFDFDIPKDKITSLPSANLMLATFASKAQFNIIKWFRDVEDLLLLETCFNRRGLFANPLTGDKLFAYATENKTSFLSMIRDIRRAFNTNYTATIATAVSQAIADYVVEFGEGNISEVCFGYTQYPYEVYPELYGTYIEHTNRALLNTIIMPLDDFQGSLIDRLKSITKSQMFSTFSTINIQASQNIGAALGCFPPSVLKLLYSFWTNGISFGLTNVPGYTTLRTCFGYPVEEMIACPPNILNIGLSMNTFSYADNFSISFYADTGVIPTRERLDYLVKKTLENIYNMHKAIH